MKHYSVPFGRMVEHAHPAPERTAYRTIRWDSDCYCQVWKSREAMARAIRKQERDAPRHDNWIPIVKLSTTEGY